MVSQSTADPELVALARARASEVVILPLDRTALPAVYSEATLMLAKTLRAHEVSAAYLDGPEDRTFEVRKSAVTELVWVPLAVGLVGNATWDIIKTLLGAVRSRRLRVDYTDLEVEGTRATTWSVEGDARAVLRALDQIRESRGPEQ